MHRFLSLILAILSIAVALAVGPIAWQALMAKSAYPQIAAADPAVGYAFYTALDRVLAGGSRDDLDRLITGDFIDHAGRAGDRRTANTMVDELAVFGRAFPGARLGVTNIAASGESLIAEVAPVVSTPGQVAGLTLSAPGLDGGIEVLRIRDGQVSERWALALPVISATTFDAATHAYSQGGELSARLFRVELPPGAELAWLTDDVSIAMVESGSVALTIEKPDELGTPVTQKTSLATGAATSIEPGARMRLRGETGQGARLLLFTAHRIDAELPWPFQLDGGANSKLLWNSGTPFELPGPWRIAAGQLVLPLDAEIVLGDTAEASILLDTQDAAMDLAIDGGQLAQLDASYAVVPVDSPAHLNPGAAIQLTDAGNAALSVSGGAATTVWVLTIALVDAGNTHQNP